MTSQSSRIITALALALETLFLGMVTILNMAKRNDKQLSGITVIFLISLCILLGALLGFDVVSALSYNIQIAIIALGVAALPYLVAEELLEELLIEAYIKLQKNMPCDNYFFRGTFNRIICTLIFFSARKNCSTRLPCLSCRNFLKKW